MAYSRCGTDEVRYFPRNYCLTSICSPYLVFSLTGEVSLSWSDVLWMCPTQKLISKFYNLINKINQTFCCLYCINVLTLHAELCRECFFFQDRPYSGLYCTSRKGKCNHFKACGLLTRKTKHIHVALCRYFLQLVGNVHLHNVICLVIMRKSQQSNTARSRSENLP